ncbi:hypothetical protein FBZ82_12062 [Azospirillum brasilense]|uniref:Insertion element IS150 protein InsJ-like helix-turn-helix domain-containing protein n=1 Tax=Azospirillum brasilense TaxID=192 RepID=A0A560AK42_AZOBR|nr:helix-turn-helix domain-containing protein [Azospirillum brasilense]TWA60692.1 hypothetical protein FBZ82_12062 [Azospirillum brasilense]
MNAETGSEPEAPKKRGRIPQSAWPQILERYRSGVTLSAIAREFECTPSAISYIIRKAEAAGEKDAPIEEGAVTDAAAAEEAPAGDAMAEEPPAPVAVPEAPAPVKPARRAAAPVSAPAPAPTAQPAAAAAAPAAAPTAAAQPTAPAQTETLRLNRPEAQPAPQPAPVQPAAPAAQAPTQAAAQPAAADANRPAGANPPPVDAVEARLRDTARGCLNAYRGWRQQPGEASIQTLSEAVHELRKALARIEIDMSASRREEQAIRPIPIPAHRTARRTP